MQKIRIQYTLHVTVLCTGNYLEICIYYIIKPSPKVVFFQGFTKPS